jgi:hypothetical protein
LGLDTSEAASKYAVAAAGTKHSEHVVLPVSVVECSEQLYPIINKSMSSKTILFTPMIQINFGSWVLLISLHKINAAECKIELECHHHFVICLVEE